MLSVHSRFKNFLPPHHTATAQTHRRQTSQPPSCCTIAHPYYARPPHSALPHRHIRYTPAPLHHFPFTAMQNHNRNALSQFHACPLYHSVSILCPHPPHCHTMPHCISSPPHRHTMPHCISSPPHCLLCRTAFSPQQSALPHRHIINYAVHCN